MTQRDQVINVMQRLDGFATLGTLNREVDVSGWATNTPYATIRRIVQDTNYFFRIKVGLWGLNSHREQLADLIGVNQSEKQIEKQNHYYYQGLLLEIGNAKNFATYIPNQDKNKKFLSTTLGQVRNLQDMHRFSYSDTLQRAKMVDVLWFNRRRMRMRLLKWKVPPISPVRYRDILRCKISTLNFLSSPTKTDADNTCEKSPWMNFIP